MIKGFIIKGVSKRFTGVKKIAPQKPQVIIKQKKREPKRLSFLILRHKPDRGYYSGFPCAPTIMHLSLSGQNYYYLYILLNHLLHMHYDRNQL